MTDRKATSVHEQAAKRIANVRFTFFVLFFLFPSILKKNELKRKWANAGLKIRYRVITSVQVKNEENRK